MPVRAFVFPGQGSQAVGMGRALADAFPVARAVFEEVDDALSQKLSALMFDGPIETLTLTENAQPALMAASIAALRVLAHEGGVALPGAAILVAGHSLGEYSALAAAAAVDLATCARLLRLRGQAMQKAVPAGEGAMAALLGCDLAEAEALCAEAAEGPDGRQVLEPANDNGGGQVVISGAAAAVDRAVALAPSKGIKRAMRLAVSAPFHCALMAPAAAVMREALAKAHLRAPVVPVVANVTAAKVTEPDEIRSLLVRQVTATVRWRESIEAMRSMGVDSIVELGAGKVLAGLVKRIDKDLGATSIGTPEEVEAFLRTI